ncbi:heavy metal translocating P-type ATPase [Solitalea koreensis]|uniref:Cu+-exporting ATPase n=1 Tax=Solitalea koreensis TaxID=543615 RepID=A0A521BFJ5_9SPHI|nr:heavy metal translocating P-type ATPase metal-binding domain-containing protein [Solitalea koreensis]SMO45490.1 Cu+-exporting ATPase [Solitalea koreensis]
MEITELKTSCYHCGLNCEEEIIHFDNKVFCCNGCKVVYSIVAENNLCEYYTISNNPGVSQRVHQTSTKFSVLNSPEVKQKLICFTDREQTHVVFSLPQIHCSSCIWLLENLHKINDGIISSRVDFTAKKIYIIYKEKELTLEQLAFLCNNIGYEPHINLNDITDTKIQKIDKGLILKLGIAGFCFANSMMLSFPEYFSNGSIELPLLKNVFNALNFTLGTLAFIYPASEFHLSACKSLKKKIINIDAPIVLALIITYTRSLYEILSGSGVGYMDALTGIIFFMLTGRYLQMYTHKRLSFERDYKSYFPIAVTVKRATAEENIPVLNLKPGDRMIIRNNELIPADAILFYGDANIDYSFVTGEAALVKKSIGELVYAGGKQYGAAIELEVIKEVSNSDLTQLWNKEVFKNNQDKKLSFIHGLSKYFSIVLLTLVGTVAIYWAFNDSTRILNSITAMLIIACPCSLLLSATFTNGSILRILRRNHFYLKNATVLESLAEVDTIVFDKTGTITHNGEMKISFEDHTLDEIQIQLVKSVASQSTHPVSKAIFNHYKGIKSLRVEHFNEIIGAGISGKVAGNHIKIGSETFVGATQPQNYESTSVFVSINNQIIGYYHLSNQYRKGLNYLITNLKNKNYHLALISGDNDAEQLRLENIFGKNVRLFFNQTPENKLDFIKSLQDEGKKVLMLGDGLNDAGALKQSNVGIAISDDINNFSPACDVILDGKYLVKLGDYIRFAKIGKNIIWGSFIISLIYNLVGLFFAVQGLLAPVIAAILMPSMSISIILFTTGFSFLFAKIFRL